MELIKYSLSGGFWHFTGCFFMTLVLGAIFTDCVAMAFNFVIAIFKELFKNDKEGGY